MSALRSLGALSFGAVLYLVAASGNGAGAQADQVASDGVARQRVAAGGVSVECHVSLDGVSTAQAEVPGRGVAAALQGDVAVDGGIADDVGAGAQRVSRVADVADVQVAFDRGIGNPDT